MSLYKLYYYGAPGRAEQIRLALHVSGVEWENNIVTFQSWSEMKKGLIEKLPEANIPLLEVDGKYLTESLAILRYVGNIGNLIPQDPFEQAKMDAGISLTNDVADVLFPTFMIQDPNEKIAARQALIASDGKLYKIMQKLDAMIANFKGGYMAGEMLSVGDICWFCQMGLMSCGMIDGIPLDFLHQFENITTFRKFIGTNPRVASRYANETEGFLFNGFKF